MPSGAGPVTNSATPRVVDDARPEWRIWIRFGITLIATLLLAFFGFSRAPKKVVDPPVTTGEVIVLTDQNNVGINVQVDASQTVPLGVSRLPPAPGDSTWMSIFVSQPIDLASTTPLLQRHRWALLLEDFPVLRTPTIVGILGDRMTVVPLIRAPNDLDTATVSRESSPNSHDYLIIDNGTETTADFAVAATHLIFNNQHGLVNATFPTVDQLGSVLAAGPSSDAFAPFLNAPLTAPNKPAVLDSITGFLDFPVTERPDNLALVAGVDANTRAGSEWSWSSASGVHVLLQDADVRRQEDRDLFWSGLLIGSAAAAGIACLLESIDLAASYRGRSHATQRRGEPESSRVTNPSG